MTAFTIVEGSPGLQLEEIAHVLIPGRGRDETGEGLSHHTQSRTEVAADFYLEQELEQQDGVIVATGYKSPADKNGKLWTPEDSSGETFTGRPEADSMRAALLHRGIGSASIRVERHSIDTATNFTRVEGEGHFPDGRPTAIVAQEEHLDRILSIVAPRTMRREYLGVVVPENGVPDPDSFLASLVSRAVLFGIRPDTPDAIQKTTARASGIWQVTNALRGNKTYK